MIEKQGITYRVGMDENTIREIAYALLVAGKPNLAQELLSNTMCTPEGAAQIIRKTMETIKTQAVQAMQESSVVQPAAPAEPIADPSTAEPKPEAIS